MMIKRFKHFYLNEMSLAVDDVQFYLSKHFEDRMKERGTNFDIQSLKQMISKIKSKLPELPPVGDFLFYSRKLKQGFIAAWDSFRSKMSLITFLPKGKEYPNPGTEKVIIESKSYSVFYID